MLKLHHEPAYGLNVRLEIGNLFPHAKAVGRIDRPVAARAELLDIGINDFDRPILTIIVRASVEPQLLGVASTHIAWTVRREMKQCCSQTAIWVVLNKPGLSTVK